jgi:hypothetical protein
MKKVVPSLAVGYVFLALMSRAKEVEAARKLLDGRAK